MKKFYHIDRNPEKPLKTQLKELEKQYINFNYMFTDANGINRKIHFLADGIQEAAKEN